MAVSQGVDLKAGQQQKWHLELKNIRYFDKVRGRWRERPLSSQSPRKMGTGLVVPSLPWDQGGLMNMYIHLTGRCTGVLSKCNYSLFTNSIELNNAPLFEALHRRTNCARLKQIKSLWKCHNKCAYSQTLSVKVKWSWPVQLKIKKDMLICTMTSNACR